MKRSQAELNSYLEAIVNNTFSGISHERPELVASNEQERVMKIYRTDGGHDLYRRKPGHPWEDADSQFDPGAKR